MALRDQIIGAAKSVLSPELRAWVVRQQRRYRLQWPRTGKVDFGQLHRVTPISPIFGIDRGQPIDRYYIDRFLEDRCEDVRGRAMELGDASYIHKFGGDRVKQIDVLHVVAGNPEATIVADLTKADHVESDLFDCIIFTQSLQMIYDFRAALETLHRILKPGGVLLCTTHGISKIGRRLGRDDWGEYWHFTSQSCEALFAEHFPGGDVEVRSWGNVLTATCALHGVVAEELVPEELDYCDPDYEVLISIRAQKAGPVA